jgi:Protein of unknown function (DUF2567)
VSSSFPTLGQNSAGGPSEAGPLPPAPHLPPRRPWSPLRELRRDWRIGLGLLVGLAVAGILVGLIWWGLAPRADFRITSDGPQVIGNPSEELLVADDSVFVLLTAALGLIAGTVTWLVRRWRGVAALLGLALGMVAAGAVGWRTGRLLAPSPTHAALTHVGGRVTTSLNLGSSVELAVGPFLAVLVYVVAALYTRSDGLGRPEPEDAATPDATATAS